MSLSNVLAVLQKKYPGAVARLSDCEEKLRIVKFSTGSVVLDFLLRGGFPFSRIIELFGPQGTFKSTLALLAAKSYLEDPSLRKVPPENAFIVWVDLEGTMTYSWVKAHGIDPSRVIIFVPEKGEQVYDGLYAILTADPKDCILAVVDSLAELSKEGELAEDMDGYTTMGAQAALISTGIRRRLLPALRKHWLSNSKNAILNVNQARDRMGQGTHGGIQGPGGHHRLHSNSVAIECRIASVKTRKIQRHGIKQDETYAYELVWKVRKNKTGGPDNVAGSTMFFTRRIKDSEGVEREAGKFGNAESLLEYALFNEVITTTPGHQYFFNGTDLGKGRTSVLLALLSDHSLRDDVKAATMRKIQENDIEASGGERKQTIKDKSIAAAKKGGAAKPLAKGVQAKSAKPLTKKAER